MPLTRRKYSVECHRQRTPNTDFDENVSKCRNKMPHHNWHTIYDFLFMFIQRVRKILIATS